MSLRKTLTYLAPIAGLIVLLAYFNFTILGIPLADRLTLILAFAIGPVAIVGIVQLHRQLTNHYQGSLLPVASVFLVVAFSFFNLMLVVQQTLFENYRLRIADANDDATKESIRQIFNLVNTVQLGIDVSFDIFYCIGLILLSIVLLHLSLSRKVLGVYGLLSGGGLLVLNLGTFPVPPAESGLIDLGPATGLFWIALIAMMLIERRGAGSYPADTRRTGSAKDGLI